MKDSATFGPNPMMMRVEKNVATERKTALVLPADFLSSFFAILGFASRAVGQNVRVAARALCIGMRMVCMNGAADENGSIPC